MDVTVNSDPQLEVFRSFAEAAKSDRRKAVRESTINREGFDRCYAMIAEGANLPLRFMRESIGSDAWDSIMLDAMNKSLTKGWAAASQALSWSKIVSMKRPIRDFRSQYAIQVGDFTTFPEVKQGGAYKSAEFTDDRISYVAKKYGQLFGVSYESATNDDLNVFGSVFQRFGGAAARTIEEFVFGTLIDDNPTIYDGKLLFHADHVNSLGASKVLDHDNLEAAIELMAAQTDIDGNPLDIRPKFLVVPTSMKYDALRLVGSMARPGTGNNDINVHHGELEVITTSRINAASAWYVLADPAQVDTIELGFLGGREVPEVFEEAQSSGHEFAYDERRWKSRIVFGGANLDYRYIVRANV